MLEDWACMVQRWVPAVLANFPGDEAKLREQIEGLLHASYSLSAEGVSHDLTTGYALSNKRGQYAAWVMLKTVLLCDNIKDAKRLRDTLLHAGTLCFPSLASHLSSIIGATTVPSASTIYRHRYFVDVAFMRYMRQKHTEEYKSSKHLRTCDAVLSELLNVGSFHYLMTDASPQGGQDRNQGP